MSRVKTVLLRIAQFARAGREGSVNRRIFGALCTIGGLTVIARLVAMGKEVLVAKYFGVGDMVDAYYVAFILPSFAITLIAGSLNAALIPTFIHVRETEGMPAAQRLFSSVTARTLPLLGLSMLALAIALPYITPFIASGYAPEKRAIMQSLFLLMLPIILLTGVNSLWSAILNAGERFALVSISALITPLVTVAALVLCGRQFGVYVLALSLSAGAVLEISLLGCALRRTGFRLRPRWYPLDASTRTVFQQYAPMIAGAFCLSSTTVVDQALATRLGSGSVASLNYGNKLISGIMGIPAVAIGSAVRPYFAKMIARKDWTTVNRTLFVYQRLLFAITIPLSVLLCLASTALVRLMFQRGAFTAADTHLVAGIQIGYALQIPFFIGGLLQVRLISSLKANSILMWGAVLSMIINVVLDLLFMRQLGVMGIALSTACVYLLGFIYKSFWLKRLLVARQQVS